jgi:type I restriction enzyme, R subunit
MATLVRYSVMHEVVYMLSIWHHRQDPMQVIEEFGVLTALPDEGVAEPRTPHERHQCSDCALLGKDGEPLAAIEAKETSRDAAFGREQAQQH